MDSLRKFTQSYRPETEQPNAEESKPFQESNLPLVTKTKKSPLTILLYILGSISVLLLAAGATNALLSGKGAKTNATRQCGNSTSEALAAGCTFDQLLWSWMPPKCPHYANEDFKAFQDWQYTSDKEGKKPVKVDGQDWQKVLDNKLDVYGTKGEHATHCVFMLLGMAKIVTDDLSAVPKMKEYAHLEHCAHHVLGIIKDDPDFNKVDTLTPYVNYEQTC